jgi:hypothetical protein
MSRSTSISQVDSLACTACFSSDETIYHYLLQCPKYKEQRRQLEKELKRDARSIRTLLSRPKALKSPFKYMNTTGRFRQRHGDVALAEKENDK